MTWIDALLRIAFHPFHLAVKSARQPLLQANSFLAQRFGWNDTGSLKTELQRAVLNQRASFRAIDRCVGRVLLFLVNGHLRTV